MKTLKGLGAKSQRHYQIEACKAVTTFVEESLIRITTMENGGKRKK
jgi:hypothetical protein